jgi:hypothetical protein
MVAGIAPVTKHVTKEVSQCIQVLAQVMVLFGFEGEFDLTSTEQHWQSLVESAQGKWMKVAKYKLAAFYAFHKGGQKLPSRPFEANDIPGVLFGGRMGRFTKLKLQRASLEEKDSFLETILQSKKGMVKASRKDLKAAEKELVTDLTQTQPAQEPVESLISTWIEADDYDSKIELTISQVAFKMQLRRTVRELYRGQKFSASDRVKAFFPSTSANYISSRKNAGAVGVILQHPTLLHGLRTSGGYLGSNTKVVEEEVENEDWIKVNSDNTGFSDAFMKLWLRMLNEARNETNLAEPVALPEALKIRVITKGPPFTQTVLRALQKKTHQVLKDHPAFTLLGIPESAEYVLNRLKAKLGSEDGYLSGDYEAATNNIQSWASREVAEAISDELKLFPIERRLYIDSLINFKFTDPNDEEKTLNQTVGQLMGSITSFPVLNIINATASRWAYEIDKKKQTLLSDWPGMCNGDDIAMKCTKRGVETWRRITRFVGLKESIGKTYYSRNFVNINSRNFSRNEENPTPFYVKQPDGSFKQRLNPFSETKFINMGLMNGQKRSGLSIGLNDQDDPRNNIGVRYRKVMGSCPVNMREKVHREFIRWHKDLLDQTHLPWYAPEWIGGIGMTGYKELKELDLRIAHMILLNWNKTRPISLAHGTANWKTWKVAAEKMPEPKFVEEKNSGVEYYNKVVGQKCIDLLFDSDIELDELFQTVTSGEKVSTAIRHNAKLWDPKRYKGLPSPMTNAELAFRTKYASYESQIIYATPIYDLD